jgi:hypothetical protein
MWGEIKDWLLTGAVETDEKMAMDLAGPGYHINRSNPPVLEEQGRHAEAWAGFPRRWRRAGADLCTGGGAAAEKEEERDEDDEFGGHSGINGSGAWMQ